MGMGTKKRIEVLLKKAQSKPVPPEKKIAVLLFLKREFEAKRRVEKRSLNIKRLYGKFKSQHPEVSFSHFYKVCREVLR
jgi:F0F1-type ATP synthase alpha subunit